MEYSTAAAFLASVCSVQGTRRIPSHACIGTEVWKYTPYRCLPTYPNRPSLASVLFSIGCVADAVPAGLSRLPAGGYARGFCGAPMLRDVGCARPWRGFLVGVCLCDGLLHGLLVLLKWGEAACVPRILMGRCSRVALFLNHGGQLWFHFGWSSLVHVLGGSVWVRGLRGSIW